MNITKNDFTSNEITHICNITNQQCYFPNCEHDLQCQNQNNFITEYNTYNNKLNTLDRYKESVEKEYQIKQNKLEKEYQDKILEIENEYEKVKNNSMKSFEKVCTDITSIFIGLNMERPYIHPLDKGILISFGEDNFNENVFPFTTELITILDEYMGCHGEINIRNNSMGDAFLPNFIIKYQLNTKL